MKKVLTSIVSVTIGFLGFAAPALAHDCHNIHKEPGAGDQAIENNGGVAGYVVRPDGVEVFIHPSVSHSFLSDIFPGAPGNFTGMPGDPGSVPEGAHNSSGWVEIPFGAE